ncbi:aldolase [Vineibacter terrae]|uniref:aldolase n=1 Tax=Vineibacter terrae TaxID=2586908 RepID=UPI002E344611|nr:aldolase [Vineibacter terrae]HEX2885180.1 aldolase [Vineibacter terrae]
MSATASAIDAVTQARIDLAAALRWAARHQLNEGVCNHFSMVVPGRDDRFLINPQGLHWSEITPADIVMTDATGTIIEGRHKVEPTAFFIHGRVHLGNKRAKVVLHTHMPYATALTTLADGRLEMCTQNAFRYHDRIAYDEHYNGLVLDNEEGDRLCRAMGDKPILFLRNHGVVVTGESVAMAYDELYYLERAALVQVLAMQTGRPLEIVPTQVVERTTRQMAGESQQALLHFEALKRMLGRDEPGWDRLD